MYHNLIAISLKFALKGHVRSVNDVAMKSWQAITWTNDDPIYWSLEACVICINCSSMRGTKLPKTRLCFMDFTSLQLTQLTTNIGHQIVSKFSTYCSMKTSTRGKCLVDIYISYMYILTIISNSLTLEIWGRNFYRDVWNYFNEVQFRFGTLI